MNLYLISQTVNDDWDTYDSAVVAAESEHLAQRTYPCRDYREFGEDGKVYFKFSDGSKRIDEPYDWAELKDITVRLIGLALEGTEAGVICASYNAG